MAQLLQAVAKGNIDLVKSRLSDVNYQNKKGETALHLAIIEDSYEIIQLLLQSNIDVNQAEKKNGFTPLLLALYRQPRCLDDIFPLLLKAKPNLNTKDLSGQTALHLSAQYQLSDIFESLLNARATPTIKDKDGREPIHLAAAVGNLEIIEMLINLPTVDINVKDNKGNTPLHWAILGGSETSEELIEYLLSKNAKIVSNTDGNTPLHCEAMNSNSGDVWPSKIGSLLISHYPLCTSDRNNSGKLAEELATPPTEVEEIRTSSTLLNRRTNQDEEEITRRRKNIALAAKAAEAHSKKNKKTAKVSQDSITSTPTNYIIAIIVLLCIFAGLYSLFSVLSKA